MTQRAHAKELAHAKVNLGLAVLARRGDGFHEVETLMARVELADEVRLTLVTSGTSNGTGSAIELVVHDHTPNADSAPLAADSTNLAYRAAQEYLNSYQTGKGGAIPDVKLELVKRIPVAAGLGGGSSDAAAVLRLLDRELGGGVPVTELAKNLGSDVPFFAHDLSAAVARGRGERLTPFELPVLHLVLVNPGFPITAAEAYHDLLGFTPRLHAERTLERLATGKMPGWRNALQPGVLGRYPQLREVLAALKDVGLAGAQMSGSGPTCFALAESAANAAAAAAELSERQPSWWTLATRTC